MRRRAARGRGDRLRRPRRCSTSPRTLKIKARAASTPSRAQRRRPDAASLGSQGHELFLSSCAACHGMNAQGIPGRAPSLHGVGALAADFYLETGRMPLPSPRAQPMRTRPAFSQAKIQTLIDYVASFGGPAIPTVNVKRGSLVEGAAPVRARLRRLPHDPGPGGIVTGARRALAERRHPTPDRRGDPDRALRDAARSGPGELSEARHRLDRALRAQHPGPR